MRQGDRPHERETESRAAGLAGAGGVATGETLEGGAGELRRQAGAVVEDGERDAVAVLPDGDGHRGAGRRVAAGVVEQVRQHLVEPLLVPGRDDRLVGRSSCHRWSGATTRASATASSGQPGQVDLVAGQRAARVQTGQQQQVLDQRDIRVASASTLLIAKESVAGSAGWVRRLSSA